MKLHRFALIGLFLPAVLFWLAPAPAQAGYYQTVEGTYTQMISCSSAGNYYQNVPLGDSYLNYLLSGGAQRDYYGAYITDSSFNPAAGDYSWQMIATPSSHAFASVYPSVSWGGRRSPSTDNPCDINRLVANRSAYNLRVEYTISQGYDWGYWDPYNPFSGSQWMINSVTISTGYRWEAPVYTSYSYQVYVPTPPGIDIQLSRREAQTGDEVRVSWQVSRGVNTNDYIQVSSWPLGGAPGSTEYSASRTLSLTQPGTYTFSARVSNEDGTNSDSETLRVTGDPITPATIDLAPKTFTFIGAQGGSAPPAQTLSISNTGKSTLNYRGQTNQSWCRLNGQNNAGQVTGGLDKNKSKDLSVSVDAPSNVGTFNCTLTVADPNATNSPQTATVTYTVSGSGAISVRWTKDGQDMGNSTFSTRYSIAGPTAVPNPNPSTYIIGRTHTGLQAGSYTLSWTSNNPPSGTKKAANFITPSAAQTLNPGATLTYTLNFVSDVPAAPSNLQATNGGGGGGQCERIALSWTDNSSNETGFHVWRSPAPATAQTTTYQGRTYYLLATLGANSAAYTDTPGSPGSPYYYLVTSYNAGGDSSVGGANSAGPVVNTPCTPNLASSTKTIREVNGTAYTSQTIRNGDTLKFQITIRNSGNATANNISVSDTLSANLSYQGNARLKKGSAASQSITGSQNGQTITFSSLGNKAPDSQDGITWLLTFDARITTSSSQAVEFAQNTASISYQGGSATTSTGLFQVRTGTARVPNIKEIAP